MSHKKTKPIKRIVENIEYGRCDFCNKKKPLTPLYIYPKNKHGVVDHFVIIWYCKDCGIKKN